MHSQVLLVYVFKLLQIISTAQVLSTFPNASYYGKKVPSIRLAAIDGRLDCFFFYSNTNNFVQLEDTKIKTEHCCSMQCTEQTTVVCITAVKVCIAAAVPTRFITPRD